MTESELAAQEVRQELYSSIRRDASFEEKANDALTLGKRYLGVDNGHLTRTDQETNYWEVIASTDPADGQFPPGLELDLGTTYCRQTITAHSQIALHDAPKQGWADDPAFETHGLHCYHGTRLVVDGEPYGTVCFVAEDPRNEPFSDGEILFTELITRLLERELEREQHETKLTRQANLATVLNRVLRHNLRNDMSIIRGHTQLMAEKLEDDPSGDIALNQIDNLLKLSQKARDLNRIVTADYDRESTDIVALVKNVGETVTQENSSASVSINYNEEVTVDVSPSFAQAVEELIENAVKHSSETPTVTVTIESVRNAVEIQISDDGPGLADHEADVLKTGTETPLDHGSGLGLWISRWIVTNHNGSVEATDTEGGTTMTISVPRKSTTEFGRR
ncbi:sensor histidine kinase [Natrinema salsiterrestre]|uniref:histidine kinase n=1 Tax=Natrinema salsiterrestre TaxID=2950540 RepID=A0A9Q4L9M6_9EURY|nr:HAMP domain-containing sensor histidine kinase [Natrinema salsiterrestre]MDF9747881.1 HAMP domain-containing histidine kinase [Natrinema salsiterrestre]